MGGFPLGITDPKNEEWQRKRLQDCVGDAIPPAFMLQMLIPRKEFADILEDSGENKLVQALYFLCLKYNENTDDTTDSLVKMYEAFVGLPKLIDDMGKNVQKAKSALARKNQYDSYEEAVKGKKNAFLIKLSDKLTMMYAYYEQSTQNQYNNDFEKLTKQYGKNFLFAYDDICDQNQIDREHGQKPSAYKVFMKMVRTLNADSKTPIENKITQYKEIVRLGLEDLSEVDLLVSLAFSDRVLLKL